MARTLTFLYSSQRSPLTLIPGLLGSTLMAASLLVTGCGDGSKGTAGGTPLFEGEIDQEWFEQQTVADRVLLSLPAANAWLDAGAIQQQLVEYDPGRAARCSVEEEPAYKELIDELGGVLWGYGARRLVDASKPVFQLGYPAPQLEGISADAAGPPSAGVEIAEADIVGLSETSALYLSAQHGLIMLDLSEEQAKFRCAAKLPGQLDQFYLHNDRLVVMTQDVARRGSHLLHFDVADDGLKFVESVDLGRSRVLDSRRFNDRLVLYTDLDVSEEQEPSSEDQGQNGPAGDIAFAWEPPPNHRMLRVFTWGESLEEELTETRLDEEPTEEFLTRAEVALDLEPGTVVSTSNRFGSSMWASDRYFVVSEAVQDTKFQGWETRHYTRCVENHTVTSTYNHCSTDYETRPNPNYTEPDNTGGDRSCTGETLSTCIRKVAQQSAKTIRVPVGRSCEQRERYRFVCDRYESGSYDYPTYTRESRTLLYIYEYTDDGFIRFSSDVTDVDAGALADTDLDSMVESLPLNEETSELSVPGSVQSVQFQNGYLYVISEGNLETFALAENSLLRTSSLQVAEGRVETAQYTADKLYLSDAGWTRSGENSVLKVVELGNAAFPLQASVDRTLPGGHNQIIPSASGIVTTGYVHRFEGTQVNMLKVGLFEDPSAVELSYLFLGTDLESPYVGDPKASFFDGFEERLFLPYWGKGERFSRFRVGVSHVSGKELVSQGAIEMRQLPDRVRPRPGTEEVIAFASSSIDALSPGTEQWESAPVFEYFTPVAVYRFSDDDDFLELLQLGNECKIKVSKRDDINDREQVSEAFECPTNGVTGYGMNLVWSAEFALSFEEDGSFEILSEERASEMWTKATQRVHCLFSEDVLPGTTTVVDPFAPPALENLVCMTAEEYRSKL